MKFKEICTVISQEEIAKGVFSMWIQTENIAKDTLSGQFISVYCRDGSRLLPRPISVCEVDKENNSLRIVYRVLGAGTKEFTQFREGEAINIVGPLGNGFFEKDKKAMLIAGGIGIPPMVELAKSIKEKYNKEIIAVLGYRDSETFLVEDLEKYAKVYIATEDGSVGTKGNVIDAIKENELTSEVIYSCGPTPMLRAVKNYGMDREIETQLSLEEKMACGVGACLACVCKSKEVDEHTHVNNKRVCVEGPVFYAEEVEI